MERFKIYQQITLRRIELKQEDDLLKGKILYALSKLRKRHERAPIVTIGELKEADAEIIAHFVISNDDIDNQFVFASKYPHNKGDGRFRQLFFSKRLLKLATISENLHIDATYKIFIYINKFTFITNSNLWFFLTPTYDIKIHISVLNSG